MKLPFTLKNKGRTNLNFSFSTILDPQKGVFLVSEEKHHKNLFPCVSALIQLLKTIDAQMFFKSVFLKTHKKKIDLQKRRVGHSVLFRSECYVLLCSKKRTLRSFPFFS